MLDKGKPLTDRDRINFDCIRYSLERDLVAPGKYDLASVSEPYPIYQQGGRLLRGPGFP